MTRKWLLILTIPLFGFVNIYDKHDNVDKVDNEFKNVEENKQDTQFRVLSATPTLNDLQDHECVIVSSNNFAAWTCRSNIEIYAVRMSCVTVIR